MALVSCPECQKEISDKAASCPNCGCPQAIEGEEKTSNLSRDLESSIKPVNVEESIDPETSAGIPKRVFLAFLIWLIAAMVLPVVLSPILIIDPKDSSVWLSYAIAVVVLATFIAFISFKKSGAKKADDQQLGVTGNSGVNLSQQEVEELRAAQKEAKRKEAIHVSQKRSWVWLAIIIIPICLLFVFAERTPPKEAPSAPQVTAGMMDAWVYMQRFVERELNFPKSADFPFGGHRNVVEYGDGVYLARSYVDAKNEYGVEIRQNFLIKVERVDGGWKLVSLEFY